MHHLFGVVIMRSRHLKDIICKIVYISSSVLGGFFLFAAIFAFIVNLSLFNESYHRYLFEKNDIYGHTHAIISSSIQSFINDQEKNSPQSYEQYKIIFEKLINSSTPDMVRENLDNIRKGIFDFIKGKSVFLPDIQLDAGKGSNASGTQLESISQNNPSSALIKLDKINLRAILLYLNRNDIADYLLIAKFIYFIINVMPSFALLFAAYMFIAGLFTSKSPGNLIKWSSFSLGFAAALGILTSLALFLYTYFKIPYTIDEILLSIPLPQDVIIIYIKNCLYRFLLLLFASSVFTALLFALIQSVRKTSSRASSIKRLSAYYTSLKKRIFIRIPIYTAIFIILASLTVVRVTSAIYMFEAEDLRAIVPKLKNNNTVTQVIAAKDDTIYAFELRVLDKMDGKPVPGLKINVSGKSSLSEKLFNETSSTDTDGTVKYSLDKGTFKLSFIADQFPEKYKMPSPVFFDLKESGIKIITISLEPAPASSKDNWGIAEIEILDSENKPSPGLQLEVKDLDVTAGAPGKPDRVIAYTNSEGIAVFKLNAGSYKIVFNSTNFPKGHELPGDIEITIQPDTVMRYTYRLVKLKEDIPQH